MSEVENRQAEQAAEAETGHPETSRPPRWRGFSRILLVALIIFACAAMLWGQRWADGETIFRGVVQEQYYILGQYAFDRLIVDEFKSGLFPLWNPLNALGTPLAGNMLSAAFYPLKVITYIWTGDGARDVYIILRLILAGLFAYALARKLGLSFIPATLCAVSFTFTGYMKLFVNENYLNADVLLPAAALLAIKLAEKPRLFDFSLMVLVTFCVLQNGHPEAALYTLLFPAFLAFLAGGPLRDRAKNFAALAGALALGAALSLPMILPFLEYWFRGYHFHIPNTGFYHYAARDAVSVVSPWFFGKIPAGAPFATTPSLVWPDSTAVASYSETALPWLFPALGAITVYLALVSLSCLRRLSRVEAAMAIFAVFFMGVTFGLPLFRLSGFLPLLNLSGNFKHPLPGVALAAAVLAGRGLEMIMRDQVTRARLANILGAAVIGIMILGVATEPVEPGAFYFNSRSILIMGALVFSGLFAIFSVGRTDEPGPISPAGYTAGAVILIACIGVLVADGYQQPMREVSYEERIAEGGALDRLEQIGPLERVYISQDVSPPNMNIVFGLSDIRVMDGVNDRRLVKAINRINGHEDRAQAGTYWYRETGYLQPKPDVLGHPLLRLFAVRYAVMGGPLPYNRSIDQVLEYGQVTAPGPGYVGNARLPLESGTAQGLLIHPPARLAWNPMEIDRETNPGLKLITLAVKIRPSITEDAKERQKDGAWFMLSDRHELAFVRYIHPGENKTDENLPAYQLKVDCQSFPESCSGLFIGTLPNNNDQYDQVGLADFRSGGPEILDEKLENLVSSETWLYRDNEAMPRVFLVSNVLYAPEKEALDILAAGEIHPSKAVIVSGVPEPKEYPPVERGLPGTVGSVDYSSQRVAVRADLWQDGWLVLGDLMYPGWRVRVDGVENRILRGDYALRAVFLEAGSREVVFSYEPWSFRIGLFVFLASFVPFYIALVLRRPPSGSV